MSGRWVVAAVLGAARRSAADRGSLLVPVGFYVIVVAVLGALWRVAAEAGGGALQGYTGAALVWYIAASEAATVPLNMRLISQLGEDIASGAVVVELLRPVGVLGLRVATEFGAAMPRLALCLAGGTVLAVAVTGEVPSVAGLALAIPALLLALACNIVAQHAFAASAFWIRDAQSAWFLYQKLVFILGGMLIPIELLPAWLQTTARALPFAAMAYAPARLMAGFAEPWLLAIQLAWLVVLAGVARAVFAAGERRVQLVGG